MPKISFLVGCGVGYLLGARAGRERYDAIARQLRSIQERPEVQQAAGVVTAQAGGLVNKVKGAVGGRIGVGNVGPSPYVEPATAGSPNGSGSR